jgi:peptidoglycan/LPS O-acetylase OafA/YrhL
MPPLVLTVALLAVYAWFVHVADAAHRLWGDSLASLFYYADYRQAFGHAPFFGYMAQTWSLSIEEQFYLIWSVLIAVAITMGSRRFAYTACICGIVVSIVDRVWIVLHASHWNSIVAGRVYYAFDTRADALFLGCLLGLLATGNAFEHWTPWAKRMLAMSALASTGVMVWIILTVNLAARSLPLWWMPISAVTSAVIIVYFVAQPRGIGSRVMGLQFFVLIGSMSYTIYIIHWPVYLAVQPDVVHWPFWPTELLRLAIIFAIAALSWHFVEQPLTRRYRRALNRGGTVTSRPERVSDEVLPVHAT